MIFDRPNAAMLRYESMLARKPRSWPPTSHPVPTLWERARALFDATVSTIGSAFALAYRQSLRRTERRELLIRLAPVEKLVRTLLIIEAITFLLMTPEGRRLRREARACAIPGVQPPPARSQEAAGVQAAHRSRLDPRAEAMSAQAEAVAESGPVDPPEWQCRFDVLHWAREQVSSRDWTPPRPPQRPGPWVCLIGDPGDQRPTPAPAPADDEKDDGLTGPAFTLARRVEALGRVIEDPAPAIRRLAARIASIPRELFPLPALVRLDAARWWHGRPEYYNAHARLACAFLAFDRACAQTPLHPRPVDPG